MSATPNNPHVVLGSVYFEEDTGDDSQPDTIQVSFNGGAAGTTLNRSRSTATNARTDSPTATSFSTRRLAVWGRFQYEPLKIVSQMVSR